MEIVKETKTFHLSTRSATCNVINGENKSYLQYDIPQMITTDENIEYIEYSIPYCIIPVSFYTINETNSRLDLNVTGYGNFSVNFEYGNYNANFFMTQFKTLLSVRGFNITLDTINNKFTITNSANFTLYGSSTIDYVMGFNDTLQASLANGVYQVVMPRPCNFLALPRICIRCPELAGNATLLGSDSKTNDVVLSVPNNTRPNGQIVFQNDIKQLLNNDSLDGLTIKITDDDGNLLNFNGISSFFVIQFDIYRKRLLKPPTFQQLKELANKQLGQNNYL